MIGLRIISAIYSRIERIWLEKGLILIITKRLEVSSAMA